MADTEWHSPNDAPVEVEDAPLPKWRYRDEVKLESTRRFANALDRPPIGKGTSSPIIPIMLIGAGAYIMWFAIHYWRDKTTVWPTQPIKSIITGGGLPPVDRSPSEQETIQAGIDTANVGDSGGKVTGSGDVGGEAIAKTVLKYVGTPYTWGGAPGLDPKHKGIGPHDCSSLVNWVIGHDLKLNIPGFARGTIYEGKIHGPTTLDWITWSGSQRIKRSQIKAGDIMCWQTHMGIAISNKEMVSAEDPAAGTRRSTIAGMSRALGAEVLVPRRLNEVVRVGSTTGGTPAQNKNVAKLIAGKYGWSPNQNHSQWDALVELWNRESGWDETAKNPSSGAYGIPQSLPGNKMAKFGKNWRHSARTQIEWGLWYIHMRYGSPKNALAHENSVGWY